VADDTGPGTLKLAVGASPRRDLGALFEDALRRHVAAHNVHGLGPHAALAFAEARVDDVRSWLRNVLEDGESVLVVEFESWSSYGAAVDTRWLLRRGH
jgi:hypothetical protein